MRGSPPVPLQVHHGVPDAQRRSVQGRPFGDHHLDAARFEDAPGDPAARDLGGADVVECVRQRGHRDLAPLRGLPLPAGPAKGALLAALPGAQRERGAPGVHACAPQVERNQRAPAARGVTMPRAAKPSRYRPGPRTGMWVNVGSGAGFWKKSFGLFRSQGLP